MLHGKVEESTCLLRCLLGYFRNMNAIDIVIIIPVLWGFYRGFMKGVVMEAATLVAFFAGVWGGMHLSDGLAVMLRDWFASDSDYVPLIAFALVFVGILIVVFSVAKILERFLENASMSIFNKIAGGAFGTLKFLLIMSVLFFVTDAVEKSIEIVPPKMKDESLLYRPVAQIAPAVIPGLKESELGKKIPTKDDVEVDVDVNLKLKDSAR